MSSHGFGSVYKYFLHKWNYPNKGKSDIFSNSSLFLDTFFLDIPAHRWDNTGDGRRGVSGTGCHRCPHSLLSVLMGPLALLDPQSPGGDASQSPGGGAGGGWRRTWPQSSWLCNKED